MTTASEVCNQHCRKFQVKRIRQSIQQKLKHFRRTAVNVQLNFDIESEQCMYFFTKHLTYDKYGYSVLVDHKKLDTILGKNWDVYVVDGNDINMVCRGSLKTRIVQTGDYFVMRLKFRRHKSKV